MPTNDEKKEMIQHYFSVIETEATNMSKWEESFVDSIKEQFENRGTLSDKQIEILERIYSERTP